MTASVKTSPVLLARYASALYDLAEQSKSIEKVQADFASLTIMMNESADLLRLTRSPVLAKSAQGKAIEAVAQAAGFDALTIKFLAVLVQNRRLNMIEGLIEAFARQVSRKRGQVDVRVETAVELTEKQKGDLTKKIAASLGKDVVVEAHVTPEILGGMVVTVGSVLIDDSVRRKLERLSATLTRGANQNIIQNVKEVV